MTTSLSQVNLENTHSLKNNNKNNITLLESRKKQTKTFYKKKSGELKKTSYSKSTVFIPHEVTVTNIQELSHLLTSIEKEKNISVVRGELTKEGRRGGWIRRLVHKRPDTPATLQEVSRPWICLDIDEEDFPPDLDPQKIEDQHTAIHQVIDKLPPQFREVSFHYQWSSSFGVDQKWGKIKLHLWFWLSTPLSNPQIKSWLSDWDPLKIDCALFNPVQVHYTAAPIFHNMSDPLIEGRSGFIQHTQNEVIPPHIEEKTKKHKKSSSKSSHKKPLKKLNFKFKGKSTPRGKAILQRVSHNLGMKPQGERRLSVLASGRYLGAWVRDGMINPFDAEVALYEGAKMNGWADKVGDHNTYRTIRSAIDYGILYKATPTRQTEIDEQILFDESPGVPLKDSPQAIRSLYDQGIKETTSSQMIALSIPAGAGKTYTAILEAIDASVRGETRVILCKNHKLATEVKTKLEEESHKKGIQVSITYLEGFLRRCKVYQKANPTTQETIRDTLDTEGRRGVCGGGKTLCPFAHSCPVYKQSQSKIKEGEIIIGVHQHAAHIKDLPPKSVIIYDEAPSSITYPKHISAQDLKSLMITSLDKSVCTPEDPFEDYATASQKWRFSNDLISTVANYLLYALQEIVESHDGKYTDTLSHEKYKEVTQHAMAYLKQLGAELIKDEKRNQDERHFKPPPPPSPKKVRAGDVDETRSGRDPVPSRAAYHLIKKLALAAANDELFEEVLIRRDKSKAWYEHHAPIKLPELPIMILDATAEQTKQKWRAVATQNEKSLLFKSIKIDPLSQNKGHFIQTTSLRTTQLYHRKMDGSIQWRTRAIGAVKKSLSSISRTLYDLPDGATIGIGTHKVLAELLHLKESDDPITRELISLFDQSFKRFKLIIGHTGSDDTGSNKFENVDALIILGTPKRDLGGTQAQFTALGVRDEEVLNKIYKEETSASIVQWLARIRHIRRSGVKLIYFGDQAPPQDSISLSGIEWSFQSIKMGRSSTDVIDQAYIKTKEGLLRGEELSVGDIELMGVTWCVGKRIIEELSEELPMMYVRKSHTDEKGRPKFLYSISAVSNKSVIFKQVKFFIDSAYKNMMNEGSLNKNYSKNRFDEKYLKSSMGKIGGVFGSNSSVFDKKHSQMRGDPPRSVLSRPAPSSEWGGSREKLKIFSQFSPQFDDQDGEACL